MGDMKTNIASYSLKRERERKDYAQPNALIWAIIDLEGQGFKNNYSLVWMKSHHDIKMSVFVVSDLIW